MGIFCLTSAILQKRRRRWLAYPNYRGKIKSWLKPLWVWYRISRTMTVRCLGRFWVSNWNRWVKVIRLISRVAAFSQNLIKISGRRSKYMRHIAVLSVASQNCRNRCRLGSAKCPITMQACICTTPTKSLKKWLVRKVSSLNSFVSGSPKVLATPQAISTSPWFVKSMTIKICLQTTGKVVKIKA